MYLQIELQIDNFSKEDFEAAKDQKTLSNQKTKAIP